MNRQRLDLALVARGLAESRAKARAAIEAGQVSIDGRIATRPSEIVADDVHLEAGPAHPWVGRGALKLIHALDLWPIAVEERIVLDVGASTGGFTEVCLARGAARVYAVDVGRGQLHPKLAADPRVIDLQATDARAIDARLVPEPVSMVVCDVSFIGLAKALPQALRLAQAGAHLIALVKPQFEAGPEHVGRGGMVKDEAVRRRTLDDAAVFLTSSGWRVAGVADSPIAGGDGAREYLLWAQKEAARANAGG
ncbi:MAG: TlyA family RNA methyltransferase [Phenylobacterium sp.]|uniref:TlyA family RNA methyltransferase n=1 Tax=Phenylobacterium sp. TaxID=1871053 RepID=UPI0027333C7D|nr:TlyA family RNA methyltransferase [Phenylobacterium sp.]MDP3175964.1 TlyA family RNA methyltransferase [Phenylobacterium sp.]